MSLFARLANVCYYLTNKTLTRQTEGEEMKSELYNFVFDMDDCLSKLLVNVETLEQIQFELANVRQQMDLHNHESMLKNSLNGSVIRILDDLLFYTIEDMNTNYEAISLLVEGMLERLLANLEN